MSSILARIRSINRCGKVLAFLMASFFVINFSNVAYAATTTNGVITDANDIRWEYELDTDEPRLTIRFYDKPSDATRVVVPSLGELTNLVPGAPSTLDTYYLRSANIAAQDSTFTELTRRESVDTTVLDMTNTSKIQILGVKPIINPEVETELVFGENMVIGDEEGKIIKANICKGSDMTYIERYDQYYCWSNTRETYHRIPNYDIMTNEEREAYSATPESIGCVSKSVVKSSEWDPDKCYADSYSVSVIDEIRDNNYYGTPYSYAVREGGAFSGYKLKLTNFNANNFNYVGWFSFEGSTFNDANTTMTIDGNAFVGSNIFQNTNIQKAIIKTEDIGEGIFRDCINLTEVEFDSSVTKTTNAAFAGSGLTSFDFSSTNIKKISPNTFSGANQLSSVNLTGIERIEYMAFSDTGIEELYLPKSIKWLGAYLFKYTSTLKRVTVAYDTLTSGTILQFNTVLDGTFDEDINQPSTTIEELTVLAPYAADEEVSDTHVSYEQYKWHYNIYTQEYTEEIATHAAANDCWGMFGAGTAYNSRSGGSGGGSCYVYGSGNSFWNNSYSRGNPSDFETDYANVDSKKNIIAPLYFYNLHGLKKITIGDGYEYVGSSAFYRVQDSYSQGWESIIRQNPDTYKSYIRSIDEINLPDSLRGVGNLAFEDIWNPDIKLTIPRDIEFIGMGAFRAVYNWSGDVDFPNLVALGDFAFDSTMVHNIVLHDKLQYMGVQVFSKCPNINDVTFDFDVFNPDLWISWARPGRSAQHEADHFLFQYNFGEQHPGAFSRTDLAKWGFRAAENDRINDYYGQQFGTITFTEKSVTDVPTGWKIDGMSGSYNNFFGHLNFDKVDLGKTGWKVLPQRAFVQAKVGEIILPEHLEVIPGDSFSDTSIREELVLPDSVRVIGDAAFNYGYKNGFSGQVLNIPDREYDWHKDPVKITKLPASLEYVGNDAFWGDYYLEADLNSPNLRSVNFRAFMGTRLRDVYLPPTMKVLRGSAFTVIPTLRNITIDFDLGALPPNYYEFNPNDFPQSFRDYAGSGSNLFKILTMSTSAYNMASQSSFSSKYHNNCLYTFYNLFNQNYRGQYIEYGNHYGKVVFTENARTSIYMTSDPGYFSQLEYDEIDLGEAGWNTITNEIPWGFKGAKIGKLTLPRGLETMAQGAFERAEITDSLTIPKSVKKMKTNAFMDAKLGGDVIFEDGPDDLTFEYEHNDTFLRATVDGTVSIPSRVKNLSGQNFMEAKLGGLELAEGVETIGKHVFMSAEIGDKVVIPSSMREIGENGFMDAKMDGLELKNGIEKFGDCSFIRAEIGGSFSFPGTVKEIGASAFMYAKMHTTGSFKEGLKTVGAGAFIHTNFADELVIPSTVESIGWSAFNAGDADVHYDTVVIKPNLTIASASNQRVHQLLWNASVDELTIDSSMLVAIDQGIEGPVSATDGGEEFWNMDIKKVTLNNLPKITYAAFNKCDKLEEVDMSRNANIRDIDDRAFAGDAKLHIIKFSPNIKNEDVRVGQYAFEGTAFTSIGDSSKDIDITAAKFYGTDGYAFAEMPKVETVDVPATFSYATIPEATFYNDPELREATVAYETTLMGNAAFANDNKLERIFIWGNTVVLDENLPGYEAPVGGMGADGDDVDGTDGDTTDEEEVDPTIPVGTDIYAYSVSPTEAYAGYDGRDDFEGVFYPLDEVLYITSNKPYVKLSDDGNDFDKSQLTVYALRRDGLVLESNDWSTWDGAVYSRNSANLTFEHMPEVMADNPAFGTVWDTPVPINLLDFGNENFAEIDFTLEKDPSMEEGVRKVNIVYTDKYTRGVPDTDIIPYTLPETPFTYAVNILCYVALLTGCAFVFRWAMKGMRRGK